MVWEILDGADRDALQALLLHHHQRQPRVGGRGAGKNTDEGDRAADPGGADRLVQSTDASDFDDEIYAIVRQLACFLSPVGLVL